MGKRRSEVLDQREKGMKRITSVAALAAVIASPMAANAANDNWLPGQAFEDTLTIQQWLDTELPGGSYTNELARAYQARAAYEAAYLIPGDTNWSDATAFANKSMEAASGVAVKPWAPSTLGVSDPTIELVYAATLKRAEKYSSIAPAACAELTALYDHMLEQFDEGTVPGSNDYLGPDNHSVTDFRDVLTQWVGAYKACYEPTSIYGFPVDHCENTDNDYRISDEPAPNMNERSKAEALAAELGSDEASGLLELIDAVIMVEGHASSTASRAYNKRLSECRAGFIRDLMVVAGVKSDRLETEGYGELKLEVPTGDGVEEYRNRRAVVVEQ